MCGFFYRATKDSSGQPNSRLWLPGFWNRDNLEYFLISSTEIGVEHLQNCQHVLVNILILEYKSKGNLLGHTNVSWKYNILEIKIIGYTFLETVLKSEFLIEYISTDIKHSLWTERHELQTTWLIFSSQANGLIYAIRSLQWYYYCYFMKVYRTSKVITPNWTNFDILKFILKFLIYLNSY